MKTKLKLNYKEIIKGLVVSLIILILLVSIGYGIKSKNQDIWAAVIVAQIGISLIWLAIRLGVFSISSRGTRRFGNALRDRKINKLGSYNYEEKKEKAKQPWELEKDNQNKSKQGIYIMFLIGIIEISSTLWMFV